MRSKIPPKPQQPLSNADALALIRRVIDRHRDVLTALGRR